MGDKIKTYEVDLTELRHDPSNANKGSERGQYMIDASVADTGLHRGVAVDANGYLVAGNKTHQAAIDAGFTRAIVVETDGETLVVTKRTDFNLMDDDPNNKARKAAYYDNRASEVSLSWDAEQLLADLNAGVDLSGMFRDDELDALLADLQPEPEPVSDAGAQVDKAEELRVKWGVNSGDLWQLEQHRLVCGDCTDADVVARVMGGEKAQLLLTSPPYGVGMAYEEGNGFDETVAIAVSGLLTGAAHVSDNGFAFVNFGERWTFPKMMGQVYLDAFLSAGWRWYDFRYWKRSQVGMAIWNTTQPHAMSDMESLFTFQKGNAGYPVHDMSLSKESLWAADGSSAGMNHPAVMALGIAENAAKVYTAAGNIVYEPFSGSGTTIIACEQLGRRARAVEISPAYVAVALQRWADATGKTPVLVE